MTVGDLFEQSLLVGLFALVFLVFVGAVRFRPSRFKVLSRTEKIRHLVRYAATRLPLAIGVGAAFFVLGAAGLTLNSHRPPGDNSPVISLPKRSGETVINLNLESCEDEVSGSVTSAGRRIGGPSKARFYSDQDGLNRLDMTDHPRRDLSQGEFELSNPLARRGLLSCYLQLPVIYGARGGYEIRLAAAEDMEVDTMASAPSPHAYDRGRWVWRCPPGKTCPSMATVGYSIEDGTKQVIVLVLASVFGALIALMAGEALIKWTRRRSKEAEG